MTIKPGHKLVTQPQIFPISMMFSIDSLAEKIYNLLRRKLQLSTSKYLEKLRLTTPNHAETTTIYEKVRGLEHFCR